MNSYGNILFDYTRRVFIVLGTLGDRQANKLKCVKKMNLKKNAWFEIDKCYTIYGFILFIELLCRFRNVGRAVYFIETVLMVSGEYVIITLIIDDG